MLTESIAVAAVGGGTGILLAYWGLTTQVGMAPAQLPRVHSIAVNGHVVAATAGMSIMCGLLFGLAPAFAASTQRIRSASRPSDCSSWRQAMILVFRTSGRWKKF
jgi:hypothetical protein